MPPKMLLNEKIGYCDQILRLSISRQIRKEAAKLPVRWHVHKEFELLLVEEGNVEIRLTDETYSLNPGDVLVIGSMEPHVTWRINSDELVYFVLHFDLQPYLDSATLMHHRFFFRSGKSDQQRQSIVPSRRTFAEADRGYHHLDLRRDERTGDWVRDGGQFAGETTDAAHPSQQPGNASA